MALDVINLIYIKTGRTRNRDLVVRLGCGELGLRQQVRGIRIATDLDVIVSKATKQVAKFVCHSACRAEKCAAARFNDNAVTVFREIAKYSGRVWINEYIDEEHIHPVVRHSIFIDKVFSFAFVIKNVEASVVRQRDPPVSLESSDADACCGKNVAAQLYGTVQILLVTWLHQIAGIRANSYAVQMEMRKFQSLHLRKKGKGLRKPSL